MNDKKQSNMESKGKNIPKLRFPGFEGEWEVKKLGEIGEFVRGLSYNKSETTENSNGTLVIRSNNIIQDSSVDCQNALQFVTKEPQPNQILRKNDIVICLANGSSNLVGKAASFDEEYKGIATVGAFCGIYRSSSPLSKYLMQTSQYKKNIELIKQGGNGALANLYGKDILDMRFPIPPTLPEQQKIASCLSSLDGQISAEQSRLESLSQHKRGLMQQLFPQEGETVPKLRFPGFEGDWEAKKLGEIASFQKGKGISKDDIDNNGQIPCIRYGELYTRYKECISDVLSRTNLPKKDLVFSKENDVIIPSSGETQEDIATASCVTKANVALGGDINIIRSPLNGIFLSYYLNSAKRNEIAKLSQGFSVVHLYNEQLKKLKLSVPTLPEQQKIASCLTAIDKLITAQQERIEALKQHKRGLMQQLFPAVANE
ncbi:MAG: restriction endonuclease subunit S [Bacteroidales bacterium]|nr:restriction endonuclease subunit S [Bacteroidales bacterium]